MQRYWGNDAIYKLLHICFVISLLKRLLDGSRHEVVRSNYLQTHLDE